nr:atp synthase subunit g, mitochondrial [Quercus suber]
MTSRDDLDFARNFWTEVVTRERNCGAEPEDKGVRTDGFGKSRSENQGAQQQPLSVTTTREQACDNQSPTPIMSATLLPRLALRQSRSLVQRRAASTTSEAASKAKDTASSIASKASETAGQAQQGLSRVSSSAGNAASSAAASAGRALSGIGGTTGQLISFVQGASAVRYCQQHTIDKTPQGLIPPTIYYARVVGELGKIVAQGRGMSPPTVQQIQSYATPLQNALRNPSSLMSSVQSTASSTAQTAASNPETFLVRVRNLDSATLTTIGVIAAETLGFFSVGTMIGRMKIVGYRSDASHAAH